MRRRRGEGEEIFEANVWPAVTDSVLLIASVFIVLSVVTMVFFVARLRGGPKDGDGKDTPLLCVSYVINNSVLFPTNGTWFRQPAAAERSIRGVLNDVPSEIERLKRYAASQNWDASGYFIVIEASGHADYRPYIVDTPYAGSDGNWALSTNRADSFIYMIQQILAHDDALRQKLGVHLDTTSPYHEAPFGSTILRASGYSSQAPSVAYTENLNGLSPFEKQARETKICDLNRRVEIRVYAQPAEVIRTRSRGPVTP